MRNLIDVEFGLRRWHGGEKDTNQFIKEEITMAPHCVATNLTAPYYQLHVTQHLGTVM